MNCPICQSKTSLAFKTLVLSKYEAEYQVCSQCGYLFTPNPYWLDEAYGDAIAATDTGLVKRNVSISAKLGCFLYFALYERGKGRYLDVAGGYGMLTRMMRDLGFNFFWQDKYCSNLLAQGFEFNRNEGACNAVTAFEALEHVTNPVEFIQGSMVEAAADTIIFSTILYEGTPPDPTAWWYYGFSTGQHIGFFQKRTLEIIGKKLGLHLSTTNKLHVLSKNKISASVFKISTNSIFSRIASYWVMFVLKGKTESDRDKLIKATSR